MNLKENSLVDRGLKICDNMETVPNICSREDKDVFAASLYHAKNLALHAASRVLYFFIISVQIDFWYKFPFEN